MKLVECVPNFSEGRDKGVIEAIARAARSVEGVRVLDVDPGAATHRTVYTFAGEPEAVLEAAFRAIAKGLELIDMSRHKGEHARQGACDVCPFVPISETTLAECVALAKRLAERVGRELGVPVYLYAEAAVRPERVRLPDIRAGEYEALEEKLKKPEWKPDFGPARFVPRSGAVTVGARGFLIAYNVNLNTRGINAARRIANRIREAGGNKRGPDGKFIKAKDGSFVQEPGMFKSVQAAGWVIPEYGRAQVTVNILDIDASPLHKVFDACRDLARELGVRVTGSEVVGMIPKRVLLEAGAYFLKKQGLSAGVSEARLVENALQSLGLSDAAPFDPSKKVIEERFRKAAPLAAGSVRSFVEDLASDSPAPGGGSVAALTGALGAGLAAMVSGLTFGRKAYRRHDERMEALGAEGHRLKDEFLAAVDDDTEAFNGVMEALRMPGGTPERDAARAKAVEEASKRATQVPLETLRRCLPAARLAGEAAEKGNVNSLSDAGAAAQSARAAAYGAYYNVLINLAGLKDRAWADKTREAADSLLDEVRREADRVEAAVLDKLRGGAKVPG